MTVPLRIAIVGSGPAGMYAAEHASKLAPGAHITIFERLPFPYGLVRYGVAPDHHRMKSVTRLYERVLDTEGVQLRLGVEVGTDVLINELLEAYDAIVYAYGAAHDRTLNIPGEHLSGSTSATEFVAWYNAHPEFASRAPNLAGTSAVVIGLGNVAIDVARVLAKSTDELAESDIAEHALAHLAHSSITDIYIVGRRGPAEARFTTKELRELGELANADIIVDPAELELLELQSAYLETDFNAAKNVEVLHGFAHTAPTGKPRRLHIKFYLSPVAIHGGKQVQQIEFARNVITERNNQLVLEQTAQRTTLPAQLVLRSVGYRGAPLADIPFDEVRGIIPNSGGRVLTSPGGQQLPRHYVAGWIKRGPSGVIGTNRADAGESIQALVADLSGSTRNLTSSPEAIDALLKSRGVDWLDTAAWRAIDAHELARGRELGRPRVKLVERSAVNQILNK